MSRIISIVLVVLALAGMGAAAFMTIQVLKPEPEQADEKFAGLSVFAERVQREDLNFTVKAQGEVRPQREIVVAPQIAGRIAFFSPDFIDGGFIRRGQVLVRLETADYQLAVVRAQSGVASAEQRLAREVAEAEVARQDLDNLGITDSSPLARREPQMAEAQAALESAKAQLADAELALSRTAVVAPFDGRVREETVDVGQFASPGQSLGRVFATDVVEVALPITDAQLGQLGIPLAFAETASAKGPRVIFSAPVGGVERQWEGRVTRSSAAVNSQTRLINVIAELNDPYGAGSDNGAPMAPGLFVTAEVDGTRIENLLVAPRSAIRGGNNIFIGEPENGALRIFPVDLVYSSSDGAWFRSNDVEVDDLAIVSPIRGSNDGMSITILERLEDGTIKNHNEAADTAANDNERDSVADAANDVIASTGDGGQ
ncbi:MAG: efflux RND transporter periplasmic adaptor subunit [Henriciella sp.]|nr:efflux RND transporter periplasmic adaptor subunit [Henriciella sp.]MBO6694197.1 efflux RND transporter periplasmic adaptor subunit [Henriciella sp.]